MRERRWESNGLFQFEEVLALTGRLAALGLKPATPQKEIIAYVEEWTVPGPEAIHRLEAWSKEDVTLVHIREDWRGDFFLLAGAYHTCFQRHRRAGTYCSVSHPWIMEGRWLVHHPQAMFWIGFRDQHSFIRVRLNTTEVITPDETRGDDRRELWTSERKRAFQAAVSLLDLPVEADLKKAKVVLEATEPRAALLCSWPDAFGPCQFEYNVPEAFAFLVPAGRMAATWGGAPATVRAYLTGFPESALNEFESTGPGARLAYRCSVHARFDELSDLFSLISPTGRLYATLCEFQTRDLVPSIENAWVIIGVLGTGDGFRIEARLNRAPLPEGEMAVWLESLLGVPVSYAPLSPFP